MKAVTENIAIMQTQPVKETAGESSKQSISHEEILVKDRINTVLILPGSIRLPASMIDVQIQVRNLVEVNLSEFPIDQLQMI